MNNTELDLGLAKEYLRSKYRSIHIIMSPPRCSSTALARLFWEHESIRYYAHEPFETTYYENARVDDAIQHIEHPLDLKDLYEHQKSEQAKGLVIKEMPYQVNSNFEFLASLTRFPLVFLIRDPRLNIYSNLKTECQIL